MGVRVFVCIDMVVSEKEKTTKKKKKLTLNQL